MTDFCYLEYGCPKSQLEQGAMVLRSLGFKARSGNQDGTAQFFSQNRSVILLREFDTPSMTMLGFGLLGDLDSIDPTLITKHDPVIDSPVVYAGGLRISLLDQHTQTHRWKQLGFGIIDNSDVVTPGAHIEFFSGLLVQGRQETVPILRALGFDFIKEGKWSATAVSKNRAFSLILSKAPTPTTVIADSNRIFDTVSELALGRHFGVVTPQPGEVEVHHKIMRYGCVQFGNEHSFSIEKFYPNVMLGNHLIVRERAQWVHIPESTLDAHLSTIQEHDDQ
jgi:hypothetical protein